MSNDTVQSAPTAADPALRYALTAMGANDGLWDWDIASGRLHLSSRWKGQLGYGEHEIASDGDAAEWFHRVHPDDLPRLKAGIAAFVDEPCHGAGITAGHFAAEYRIRHRDGRYRWALCRAAAWRDGAGRAARLAGSQTDLTDRKLAERLCRDAFHDSLTGLANHTLLTDRLGQCLRRMVRQPGYQFAVLLLDVDRLRVINDTLGAAAGDALLAAVSVRLSTCVRGLDLVARPDPVGHPDITGHSAALAVTTPRAATSAVAAASAEAPSSPACTAEPVAVTRVGGDEFVLVLDGIGDGTAAVRVFERVQQALARPFDLSGQEVYCSASVGIALGHPRYTRPEEMLRDADTALYHAKAAGTGRYQVFDEKQHAAVMAKWRTENDLRHAIDRDELRLHFQPIVSLDTGEVIEVEALVRWQHPERGMIPPGEFIPLAEETGLIVPLGQWVLREACAHLRRWRTSRPGGDPLPVAVNVSARQLVQRDLVERVSWVLQETGVEARWLRLEITETAVMENAEAVLPTLSRLRELGVQLHLDDFGTGYSSLACLHRLPLDTVKIDRSFVATVCTEPLSASIVQTILALANRLDLQVIAEGIETKAQAAFLRRMGVGCAQGYLYAKPMAAEQLATWLIDRQPVVRAAVA